AEAHRGAHPRALGLADDRVVRDPTAVGVERLRLAEEDQVALATRIDEQDLLTVLERAALVHWSGCREAGALRGSAKPQRVRRARRACVSRRAVGPTWLRPANTRRVIAPFGMSLLIPASLGVARSGQEAGGDEPGERHERADRERGRQAPPVGDPAERRDAEAAGADGEADDEPRGHPRVAGQVGLAQDDRYREARREHRAVERERHEREGAASLEEQEPEGDRGEEDPAHEGTRAPAVGE